MRLAAALTPAPIPPRRAGPIPAALARSAAAVGRPLPPPQIAGLCLFLRTIESWDGRGFVEGEWCTFIDKVALEARVQVMWAGGRSQNGRVFGLHRACADARRGGPSLTPNVQWVASAEELLGLCPNLFNRLHRRYVAQAAAAFENAGNRHGFFNERLEPAELRS